jgi:stearoyl-CoA desaturase (delta-9 desaturase)
MASMITESIKTVLRHHKEKNLNWPMIIYIGLAHVAAVIGLYSLQFCHKYTLLWAFILWPISGLGITGGVHRLWSHRSYKATFSLRLFLMLANSIANQGSIWHWSRDHRVHHKYSEVRIIVFLLSICNLSSQIVCCSTD